MTTNLVKLLDRLEKLDSERNQHKWCGIDFLANDKCEGHLAIHHEPHGGELHGMFITSELKAQDQKFISVIANTLPLLLDVIKLQDECIKSIHYITEDLQPNSGHMYLSQINSVFKNCEKTKKEIEKLLEDAK